MNYRKFVLLDLILSILFALGLTYLLNAGKWEWEMIVLALIAGYIFAMNLPGLYVKTSDCDPGDVVIHPQIDQGTAEYKSDRAVSRGGYNYFYGYLKLPGSNRSFASVDCWLPANIRQVMVWHDEKHGWAFAEVVNGKRTGRAWKCNWPATGNKVRVSRGRAFL